MFRLFGGLLKWGLILGVVVAVLVPVLGAGRIENVFHSIREHLRENVDDLVDTRLAMRREIRELEDEYPKRIGGLRAQLAEVERDLSACEGDRRIAEEVVKLCEGDVAVLRGKLEDGGDRSRIEFRSRILDRGEALERAARISEAASTYRERLRDLTKEEELLRSEREFLRAELARTDAEFREFQAEVGTLLREIDSLERKEKLVELAERHRRDSGALHSERAGALASLKTRIERRKAELDERLGTYRTWRSDGEYEARARLSLAENRE
jgi:chromosome segregation ATPase